VQRDRHVLGLDLDDGLLEPLDQRLLARDSAFERDVALLGARRQPVYEVVAAALGVLEHVGL
jgi:hypothetical protein